MRKILTTGVPGVGKSTLLADAIAPHRGRLDGFVTREIREGGVRQGFRVETLDDPPETALLAHRHLKRCERMVGPYHVDVGHAVDTLMVGVLRRGSARPLVIDEIAAMELLSANFREEILRLFSSDVPLVATVHARSDPFTDALKARSDVRLFTVTADNRDALRPELARAVANLLA